jgi:hypothetical protein
MEEIGCRRIRLLSELQELLFGPLLHAAKQAGWREEPVVDRAVALMNAAISASLWDGGYRLAKDDPDEVETPREPWWERSPQPSNADDPRDRLEALVADVEAALQNMRRLTAVAEGTDQGDEEGAQQTHRPSEPPPANEGTRKVPPSSGSAGPFGIELDLQEWKALRGKAIADFAGKGLPWKIFLLLCKQYPRRTPPATELVDSIWDKGYGSASSLYVHISRIRDIIASLGLTVKHKAKVGYVLEELPGQPSN